MNVIAFAKYFFSLSMVLVAASLILLVAWGPNLSIEFSGGTRAELISADGSVTKDALEKALRSYPEDLKATVNTTKNGTFLVRMTSLGNEEFDALMGHLNGEAGTLDAGQFTTIGPTVGATLKGRSLLALVVASFGIVLYIAWAFRKMPRSLSTWKFGIAAVLTLLHDIIITVGIFTILSHVTSFEIDTLFVTALLTILGYSVNDTIIIFDRIRDNMFEQERGQDFATTANNAVLQSVRRSTYTSVSTLIMLLSLYFFGSESIRWFVLTLIVGISIGTYSSIFVATPLLVYWRRKA